MVKNAFYDPWKFITIGMKEATCDGINDFVGGAANPNDPDSYRIMNSKLFFPVGLDNKCLGRVICDDAKTPIGVVSEVFNEVGVGTQVCIRGIVPMKVAETVKPGQHVIWTWKSGTNTKEGLKPLGTPREHLPVGISLKGGSEGDIIPVLLKL